MHLCYNIHAPKERAHQIKKGKRIMENIEILVKQYQGLLNELPTGLDILPKMPEDWATTLTGCKVYEMRETVERMADTLVGLTNALYDLERNLSVSSTKNTVETIGGYIAQGFTAEEAVQMREHDILFNKLVDGEITPAEKERMFAIVKDLDI
jgi:hypothetical protein